MDAVHKEEKSSTAASVNRGRSDGRKARNAAERLDDTFIIGKESCGYDGRFNGRNAGGQLRTGVAACALVSKAS